MELKIISLSKFIESKTCVVDIHKKKGIRPYYDIYVGRADNRTEFKEDSIWSNPFTENKYGKKRALELFEPYLVMKIKKDPKNYNINKLKSKKLGCWCITTCNINPLVCHAQVIIKIIRNLDNYIKI